MISKHPDPQILVEYSSGTLALAPSIAVTTHLQLCGTCHGASGSLNQLGGEMIERAEATPVSEDLLEKVLANINEGPVTDAGRNSLRSTVVDDVAHALPNYVRALLPQGSLHWQFLSPSLRVATLSVGEEENELALHRIKAGGKAPVHNHRGQEITVVLTGTFSDEDGIYQPGDFIVRQPGEVHRPMAAQNEECICLSVLAAPIKLTGINRLMNPFLSFSPS